MAAAMTAVFPSSALPSERPPCGGFAWEVEVHHEKGGRIDQPESGAPVDHSPLLPLQQHLGHPQALSFSFTLPLRSANKRITSYGSLRRAPHVFCAGDVSHPGENPANRKQHVAFNHLPRSIIAFESSLTAADRRRLPTARDAIWTLQYNSFKALRTSLLDTTVWSLTPPDEGLGPPLGHQWPPL